MGREVSAVVQCTCSTCALRVKGSAVSSAIATATVAVSVAKSFVGMVASFVAIVHKGGGIV